MLVFRSRWPSATLVGAFVPTLAYWSIGYPRGPVFLALVVAFVTAIWCGRRRVALAVALTGAVAFPWLGPVFGRGDEPDLGAQIALLTWLVGLATFSELLRARRGKRAEAARLREAEAQRLADEERLRIARELHDVLAHNISLMSVQSGVALHLMDEHPEQAGSRSRPSATPARRRSASCATCSACCAGDHESRPARPAPASTASTTWSQRAWTAGLRVRRRAHGRRRGRCRPPSTWPRSGSSRRP